MVSRAWLRKHPLLCCRLYHSKTFLITRYFLKAVEHLFEISGINGSIFGRGESIKHLSDYRWKNLRRRAKKGEARPMKRLRRYLAQLVLIAASILLTLFVLEIYVRQAELLDREVSYNRRLF